MKAIFPPVIVRTDSVFGISSSGTWKMFCESTAKSANLPGSSVPLLFSANSAYAAVRVKAFTFLSQQLPCD